MSKPLNLAAFQSPAASRPAPASVPTEPDWQSLDTSTLSPDLQSAYFAYRKAADAANNARKTFEAGMAAKVELPPHLTLAFGYRFGKLSVAIVPAKRPSTAKAALSLSDLISRAG